MTDIPPELRCDICLLGVAAKNEAVLNPRPSLWYQGEAREDQAEEMKVIVSGCLLILFLGIILQGNENTVPNAAF